MIDEKWIIAGSILNIIGSVGYLVATVKGKTRPNRITWFLWALAPLIAFGAAMRDGVSPLQGLMTFMVGFGPLMIFLSSFVNRNSVWKATRFDYACGALSVLGLLLWMITGSGWVAIICSISADALAAIPTLVKSYKYPESESWQIFFFGALSASITLLAIDTWDLAHAGFPLYILIICLVFVALIKYRIGTRFSSQPAVPEEV